MEPMKWIPLRAKDGSIRACALVDDADFEWLSQWHWHLSSAGYVARNETQKGKKRRKRTILMHRQILTLEYGDPRMGEHENRDPLDCRRTNLRIAARGHADNKQNVGLYANNTSGYRGVCWYPNYQKWMARAQVDGKGHTLGYFDTPEEADAVVKLFREEHMPFSSLDRAVS
jgi:AP2 domain